MDDVAERYANSVQAAAGGARTVAMTIPRCRARSQWSRTVERVAAPSAVAMLIAALIGCAAPVASAPIPTTAGVSVQPSAAAASPGLTRIVHPGDAAISIGQPIAIGDLAGRIVTDDFEDVFAMDPDGSNVVVLADAPGAEFDGAWSPDGRFVVYRDSTRGLNEDDEIFVVRSDGKNPVNITNNPANDWGPDWSPDGSTIVFNSDRNGGLRGYFMNPDGSDLRPVGVEQWFEYPAWSPDGTRIVFEGAMGSNYEIFVLDVRTGAVTQLTNAPGDDSWPVWSPDGTMIAFSSERDDCRLAPAAQECWDDGEPDDDHRDIWLMGADGSDLRRVTAEAGQFVAFSPDGQHLLISGRALYVVRLDGTGRLELRAEGMPLALGGIPDWTAADR
jgi:Tol biopolymer transport system component